jgi:hypothetical protein
MILSKKFSDSFHKHQIHGTFGDVEQVITQMMITRSAGSAAEMQGT